MFYKKSRSKNDSQLSDFSSYINTMKPEVSVIIPLYNKREGILDSVGSVLSQTFADFELIVVNDGSNDGSDELVRGIGDPRIRVINQENAGVCVARNHGVECSETDWIAFLDADDTWKPRFLEVMMHHAQMPDCHGFLGSNQEVGRPGNLLHPKEIRTGAACYFDLCSGSRSAVHSSCNLISKKWFNQSGGFVPGQKLFEDWTLWMKLGARHPFYLVNEVLSAYHHGGDESASRIKRAPADIARDIRTLLDSGDALLQSPDIAREMKASIARYLTKVILHSSCPHLLMHKGRREAFEMLRRLDRKHLKREDWPWFLLFFRRVLKSYFA